MAREWPYLTSFGEQLPRFILRAPVFICSRRRQRELHGLIKLAAGLAPAFCFQMLSDPVPFLVENYRRYGPIFRVKAVNRTFTVLGGPEANLFFSRRPGMHYLGSRKTFEGMVRELKSPNLIISVDGERHQYIRQLLRPAYSREMLDRQLPQLSGIIETMVRGLPTGQSIPLRPLMQRLIAEQLSYSGLAARDVAVVRAERILSVQPAGGGGLQRLSAVIDRRYSCMFV
jgi:cytochrome P450